MKRCPTCQKDFADSMRFCQTDGTPLVDSVVAEDPFKTPIAPPNVVTGMEGDPMKTMVVSPAPKEDELLQIPEVFDPMKTMVMTDSARKTVPPPVGEPVVSAPEPPKFSEPSLSPPIFADVPGSSSQPPKFDSPFSTPVAEPPTADKPISSPFDTPPPVSPFSNPPKVASPFSEPPKFDSNPLPSESAPFNPPTSSPFGAPPPFKEPTFGNTPPPFDSSPFNQPQTPFGQPVNDQFNPPSQQNDWTPPPAPVANWGDQGIGSNTPFSPPPVGAGGGQNQTLPIVSLVLGIVSLCCYISPLTGIAALITGFLGLKNANSDPTNFGGKPLAIAGMITGGIMFLVGIAYYIYVFVIIGLVASGSLR